MIDDEHISAKLSDEMKSRIASGAVTISEDEAKANVAEMVAQLCCGRYDPAKRQALMEKMRQGEVDCAAQVEYQLHQFGAAQPNPDRYEQSMMSLVFEASFGYSDAVLGDEVFMREMVARATPNVVTANNRAPAYAYAFFRFVSENHYNPYSWLECRADGRMDMEIVFDRWIDTNLASSAVKLHRIQATLVNQLCEYQDVMLKTNQLQLPQPGIWYLLNEGAILAPEWVDLTEVRRWNKDYKAEWQAQYDLLKQAIAQKDGPKVKELIEQKALARAFSLGEAQAICSRAFWGDFWQEGKDGLFALPFWVQEHMGPEMTAMMAREMPGNRVAGWRVDRSKKSSDLAPSV